MLKFCRSSRTLEEGSRQRIKNIETCARKAGIMVSTLLDFTRNVRSKILPLNINDVVRESMKLVEGFLDQRIRIKMFLDPEIPVIEGDDNRLGQVMMNLIANSQRRYAGRRHNNNQNGNSRSEE